MKLSVKQKTGLCAAVIAAVVFSVLPGTGTMTSAGMKTVGLLLAFLLILVTEALPVIVTSLIFCGLMPFLGVTKDLNAALGADVSPALIVMSAAFAACNCYLLPLDTVPLITFSKGYYSMTDMMKSTVFMQLALVVLCALWVPVVGKMFGFL